MKSMHVHSLSCWSSEVRADKLLTVIDSHCHLADKAFDADLHAVVERAGGAGVTTMICIADSMEESKKCLNIAEKYEQIFCTVGVHPHKAKDFSAFLSPSPSPLPQGRGASKVVAIGEIGLDYHYDFSPRELQQRVFRAQLALAKELNLPAVIHNRESMDELRSIINDIDYHHFVLHCCTEPWQNVKAFVERGAYLSFTGIATYPNSGVIRDTIKQCPLDRLMIETDAPYLSPEALRAKEGRAMRNEPAFVVEVAKCVAQIKGISVEEVDAATSRNAVEFFRLPS